MDPAELIGLGRELAAGKRKRHRGTPRQADLRRAVSSAYYAMFHALCTICARSLAGASAASTDEESWRLAYRALEHGNARSRFLHKNGMQRFPIAIKSFGKLFVEIQEERNTADYEPATNFESAEVEELVEDAADAIAQLRRSRRRDQRALALYLLLRPRRD